MLGKKEPCIALSLELYSPFDFQQITYSVIFSFFNSSTLNIGS